METNHNADATRRPTLFVWNERRYWLLVALLLLLGAFLRANRYFHNRSLWLDEAALALNVLERSPLQLLEPLSYRQVAPVGFLIPVKLLASALGPDEMVLRLIPQIAGLAALPLFYLVAREFLPAGGVLLALALFAISDSMADYSSQFKQYSSDVAATLALVLAALWFYEKPRSPLRLAGLAILGMVAVWVSHPAAIVLAGVGSAMVIQLARRRRASEAVRAIAASSLWLGSFLATYLLAVHASITSRPLVSYWQIQGAFLPWPTGLTEVETVLSVLAKSFEDPLGLASYSGAALLFVVGAVALIWQRDTGAFLLAPLLVAVGLAALRLYPFQGRLLLFAVPLLIIVLAAGFVRVMDAFPRPGAESVLVAVAAAGLIMFQPLRYGLARGLNPRDREEMRPVVKAVKEDFREGDTVAVYYAAQYAYRYYAHLLGFEEATTLVIKSHQHSPGEYRSEVSPLAGGGRVWVVFSHLASGRQGSEEKVILGFLDELGTQVDRREQVGASLYLYDMGTRPRR